PWPARHAGAGGAIRGLDDGRTTSRRRLRAARPPPTRPSTLMTITVLLADDQALVRGGLRLIVNTHDDIPVVAEASDGHQAIELARRLRPDVVLMDIRMPHLDGLEATRQLSSDQALAATRLLILTTFDLDAYVYEALRAGARGFLLKDAPPEQLVDAIRIVARGDALLAPSITRRLIA